MSGESGEQQLRALIRNGTFATVGGAGHMMHHERPEELAALIERFLDLPGQA
jgi:pimeloyl-ACP methyl ester carboxylesterase